MNDEMIEVYKHRNYVVSKSNDIVQKSRYELSVTEQRAIAYICSLIKPVNILDSIKGVSWQLEYEFNIVDYARTCGISADNGRIYEETKNLLKGLIQRVMWIELPDGTETTVNWVSKVWTNKRSGKARIRIDEDIAPYLFELREKFVSYGLLNILAMKSQYSIRLYELFKSYAYRGVKVFDIGELKRLLMVNDIKSYERYPDFRRKVLDISQNEINRLTDLNISYEPITKGRKVIKIKFVIQHKDIMERLSAEQTVNNELDKE